jgi:N-acetylglucosamine malate deacetylase 2
MAVCAHPDDESFGLGALLAAYAAEGTRTTVLCFTRGEASTLGPLHEDLTTVRTDEFEVAADVLGVTRTVLLDYPDGRLGEYPTEVLAAEIERAGRARGYLVFDEGGVTGHPDHIAATRAAVRASMGRPVLAWTLPTEVADALNARFGTAFVGRPPEEIDLVVAVDRSQQRSAIELHESQSRDNPVLARRLELLGDTEHLRWLVPPRK